MNSLYFINFEGRLLVPRLFNYFTLPNILLEICRIGISYANMEKYYDENFV